MIAGLSGVARIGWLYLRNGRGPLIARDPVTEATLDALDKYLDFRGKDGEDVLVFGLNSLQAERYLAIAERSESQEDFAFGWMLQRVVRPA